ncbi:MAG TPA: hypothetical protein VGH91_03095 [Gammaproteobacteria bacterium]|jgi:hypothetical protein
MSKIDSQKVAEAAKRVMSRSSTEITEVIEKDEDKSLTLTDRFAAAFAALLVCGICYFGMWFWLEMQSVVAANDIRPGAWLWLWTWRTPFIATAVTGIFSFFRPGMAYRYFGKVTNVFGQFLMYWGY